MNTHRRAAHAKRQNQDHYTAWIRVIAGNKEQPTKNADQINTVAFQRVSELARGVAL